MQDDLAGQQVDALDVDGILEADGVEAAGDDLGLALIQQDEVVVLYLGHHAVARDAHQHHAAGIALAVQKVAAEGIAAFLFAADFQTAGTGGQAGHHQGHGYHVHIVVHVFQHEAGGHGTGLHQREAHGATAEEEPVGIAACFRGADADPLVRDLAFGQRLFHIRHGQTQGPGQFNSGVRFQRLHEALHDCRIGTGIGHGWSPRHSMENAIMLAAGQGEGKQRQGPAGRNDGTEGAPA